MSVSSTELVWLPATVGQQWLKLAMNSAQWYAAVLDPRPDLSIPARSLKAPYVWWW